MASTNRTLAVLRFFGDALEPDDLTRALGVPPTQAARKGAMVIIPAGAHYVSRTGSWRLKASAGEAGGLDEQLQQMFASLTSDLDIWNGLSRRFQADVFCGLVEQGNEGLHLNPGTLRALAERGLRLSLDIYDPIFD